MTKSKTQKVKVNVDDVKKEEKKAKGPLDDFFAQLEKAVEETADKLGIRTDEPNDYYVAFCYKKDGQMEFGGASFGTNVNPFARCGYGLRMLEDKIKMDYKIEGKVIILNVIKLGGK